MSEKLDRLASMAYNQIIGGLGGYSSTTNINIEELKDEIIATRMQLITNYARLNLLPEKDLYLTLECLPVDCKTLVKCCEDEDDEDLERYLHFQIPQVCLVAGDLAIAWIGNIDKTVKFRWCTSPETFKYDSYRRYKSKKNNPIVLIFPTPNNDGFLDCYIKGLDYLEKVSISAIFKDFRLFDELSLCCLSSNIDNISAIDNETVQTVVNYFFKCYRLAQVPVLPHTNNPGNNYPGTNQAS